MIHLAAGRHLGEKAYDAWRALRIAYTPQSVVFKAQEPVG